MTNIEQQIEVLRKAIDDLEYRRRPYFSPKVCKEEYAALAAIEQALKEQPDEHIVVTTDESGQRALAVTVQDSDYRILRILWTAPDPAPAKPQPIVLQVKEPLQITYMRQPPKAIHSLRELIRGALPLCPDGHHIEAKFGREFAEELLKALDGEFLP